MSSKSNSTAIDKVASGESRRSFLIKLGIGAAALGLIAGSLSSVRKPFGSKGAAAANTDFPGEDSIFHPAQDPRTDPRRTGRS